jgi:2-methylcitrate dehydratase PrpD
VTTRLEDRLLDHALGLRFGALPSAAVDAAVSFVSDSISVGLAGSRHPRLRQVRDAARGWGAGDAAGEWIAGERWPAPTAALLNAYQIHNQEFDCVHERAVVHPLATILPALVAEAERCKASGAALIEALVLAVDVAATIGCAQAAPMRFFRPAMCGALGATMGLAKLAACPRETMADAFGIVYSQLAGTMQAHIEGSPMLALQVGLAARAAVTALDLARAGFSGPRQVLEGPFGYFELFDAPLAPRRDAVTAEFDSLGQRYRITEVSHKPFPTGRAAHGALDGLASLVAEHGIAPRDIERVELAAPPLVLRLVGRPWRKGMDVNYARLCLPYLVATWLLHGDGRGHVGLEDFAPEALADPARGAWAERVHWRPNDCADPNALAPQRLTLTLAGGRRLMIDLPAVLGHPERPLGAAARREKFERCCAFAGLPSAQADALHDACVALPGATGLGSWLALMRSPS